MTRIVVDLTEFNTWSGHQTGVQRVVYGLADALANTKHDVEFVAFDKTFQVVNFEEFAKTVEATSVEATALGVGGGSPVKVLLKKTYNRLPVSVRSRLTPTRKDKLKKIYYKTRTTVRNIKNGNLRVRKQKINSHPFQFMRDDMVLSASRAWDDTNYMTALESAKQNHGVRLAYVLYDLIPIYQQQTFGPGLTERYSRYLYRALKNADYLLPISRSTAKDIVRFASEIGVLDVPEMHVIRLGDEIVKTPTKIAPTFVINPDTFAISVGTIEARKNHLLVYYAYKLAAERGIELPDMYFVGKPGWLTGDVLYFMQNDTDTKDKIKVVSGGVSDADLAWLYKNALFTVYPSQYEGWGLPIAESLAYGTPVIASHSSSMAEISPLVDYVSPFDSAEFLEKMIGYTTKAKSNKKRSVIKEKYTPYPWAETVKPIIDLL